MIPEEVLDRLTPKSWARIAARRAFANATHRAADDDIQLSASQKLGVVPQTSLMEAEEQKYMLALSGTDNFKHVEPGDFVISLRSFEGGFEHSAYRGCVSPAYTVLRPRIALHSAYFRYLFKSDVFRQMLGAFNVGVRDGKSIRYEDFASFRISIPPADSQRNIASYLDRESARINALIEKKTRFIELLREKRQALITQAVTRGLNPAAPTKDTGVAWLGRVPAHWRVLRVRYVARLESGHTPDRQNSEYWTDCDIPWVSLSDSQTLRTTDVISETAKQINDKGLANSSARMLPAGTVLMTRDATVGLSAIAGSALAVSQHLVAWVPSEAIISRYLLYVLRAMEPWLHLLSLGATIKTIGMDDIRSLITPVPPVAEQDEIVDFVIKASLRLDRLIEQSERSVELLRERRAALITAAVTGQIDIREAA